MNTQQLIEKAITEKKLIAFFYDGHRRVVKPHMLGLLGGTEQLHAFQIEGSSASDQYGWKNFHVQDILQVKLLAVSFYPEKTFHPENANYSKIFKKL